MKLERLQPKIKSQIIKISWIILFWTLINLLQFFTFYSTLVYLDFDLGSIDISKYFTGSIFTGLFAGLLGGTLIVLFWEKWLRTKSYRSSIVHIFISYTLTYVVVALIGELFINSGLLGVSLIHSEVWQATWTSFTSLNFFNSYLFWLVVVIITLIALLANDKYGPGIFVAFLLGRYFHPRRENRIFMFLDLRGSTTIAEKLGEELYFNFLRNLYKDITPEILNFKGEIYQYVGDEIVISWKKRRIINSANFVKCFLSIQQTLSNRASLYKKRYEGVVPEFKAGLHCGSVMAGEIGIVKRDIAYSGDVLNTTARIQGLCNKYNVNILISGDLVKEFSLEKIFYMKSLGTQQLRGKNKNIELFTLVNKK